MGNLNEENYLDDLLKNMNEETVDSEDIIASDEIFGSEDMPIQQQLDTDNDTVLNELSEEYNDIFEPEDNNFKISDIPDREPLELSQRELDRLEHMDADTISSNVISDNPLVETLSSKRQEMLSESEQSVTEESASNFLNKEISNEVTSEVALTNENMKKKNTKEKRDKKDKPIKAKKNFSLGKFIRNIFFEEIITEDKAVVDSINKVKENGNLLLHESDNSIENETNEPKDENERVIQELFGNVEAGTDDVANIQSEKQVKKGFIARIKEKIAIKKAKSAELDKAFEEAEEKEIELNKIAKEAKKAKKAAAQNKKTETKNAKASKPKKQKKEKVKKPKKEKKPKEPTKPEDLLKIKPVSLLFLILFVSGVVILVQIGISSFYYTNDINKAKRYYELGNYEKAYEALHGTELKASDEHLYDQICTIMYVRKQYISYQNYVKLGMGVDALDSLVMGIQSYYDNYPTAKDLGVSEQLDAAKAEIVQGLKTSFSMSEEKAIGYSALSKENFTQYYMTLESYGGMVTK